MYYVVDPPVTTDQLRGLYEAVEWTNYTQNPNLIEQSWANSLWRIGAFDDEGSFVGFLRAVGDGHSIVFIQDIIVLPEFQRQGIGRTLVQQTLDHYHDVYQVHLLTDNQPKTVAFYQSLGFLNVTEWGCVAFTWTDRN